MEKLRALALLAGIAVRLLMSDLTHKTPSVLEASSLLNGRSLKSFEEENKET